MKELRKKGSAVLNLEEPVVNRLAFKSSVHRMLWLYGVPICVTSLLYLVRFDDVPLIQVFLAFALMYIPWSIYVKWREGGREELPIFAMVAFMFWITYGVPLFLEEHVLTLTYDPRHHLSQETITYALLMPVIGISCLWLGIKVRIGRFLAPRTRLFIDNNPARLDYVRIVLIVGALLNLYETPLLLLGEGGRQFVGISISIIPLLAFAILLRHVIRGDAGLIDKILVAGFLIAQFLTGLGSGMLAGSAALIVVCGSVYLMERRRVPGLAVIAVVVFYLFFQIGKGDFRETFWRQHEQAGQVERVMFWTQSSLSRWSEAITEPSRENIRTAISPSVARVSLLTQTANVIDMTPEVVPYQYGQTYSYMIVTWIPRFLWPNKPSVNEANQFYQVAYGLSEEQDLNTVSIAVGFMAEGFINFGWVGVAGITFLVGVFFDFYRKVFLTRASGLLLNGIGVVMLGQLLSLEFQIAQYFGGITQQIVVALLVMLPVIRIERAPKTRMFMPVPQPSE